jgi:hypothetical protein
MQQIHDYIEQLMAQGKADPKIRGWSMQTIMTQVGERFATYPLRKDPKLIAKEYIMDKCGVTDDE